MFKLYCEICNFKQICDEIKLVEHKKSKIQTSAPKLVDGKLVEAKFTNQPKFYKCPKCGRLIKPKEIK